MILDFDFPHRRRARTRCGIRPIPYFETLVEAMMHNCSGGATPASRLGVVQVKPFIDETAVVQRDWGLACRTTRLNPIARNPVSGDGVRAGKSYVAKRYDIPGDVDLRAFIVLERCIPI